MAKDQISNLNEVIRQLTEGLDYTKTQINQIRTWLLEYQTANQLSLHELNELCWKDSCWIFDQVFG